MNFCPRRLDFEVTSPFLPIISQKYTKIQAIWDALTPITPYWIDFYFWCVPLDAFVLFGHFPLTCVLCNLHFPHSKYLIMLMVKGNRTSEDTFLSMAAYGRVHSIVFTMLEVCLQNQESAISDLSITPCYTLFMWWGINFQWEIIPNISP